MILGLIDEAVAAGARRGAASRCAGLSHRSLQRWERAEVGDDGRAGPRTKPANALSAAERKAVIAIVNLPEYRDLPPKQVVPRLADAGHYCASESTIYRILRTEAQLAHRGRALHSDNGGPMRGSTMLATLQHLGIVASFSRPSVSDDNPYIESLFRTLKYRPGYPHKPFETIEQARAWVTGFVAWYNAEHRHSGIRFVTPDERHDGREHAVLANRVRVYERARRKNPNRWSCATRNWSPTAAVFLNPKRDQETIAGALARAHS